MNITILHRPNATDGGDWLAANAFTYELRKLGVDVALMGADKYPNFRNDHFVYLYAACSPDWGLRAAKEVKKQGKTLIVSPFWWSRAERQTFYGKPGQDLAPGYTEGVAEILNLADVLFTVTMSEAVECRKLAPRAKVFVIGIGCDTPPELPEYTRHNIVLSLGRIEPHKNQLMTVRAAKELGFPIILAGKVANIPYWDMIQNVGWDITHIIPNERQKWQLLAGSRIHALPSFFENPGLVHAEASLVGTPSVMGGHGCEPEFFGDNGIYCDPTNLGDITDAMAEAWDRKPGEWAHIPEWSDVAWKAYCWMNHRLHQ